MPDNATQHRRTRIPGLVDSKAVSGVPYYSLVSGLVWGFAADQMPVVADSTAVGSVPDLAGGSPATQASGTLQPLYRTGQINGLPALQFDGTDDYIELPNVFGSLTAAEVFLVVKLDADPPPVDTKTGFWRLQNITSDPQALHVPFTDGTIYDGFGSTTRKTTVNPTLSMASWRVYQVASASGAWTSFMDGTQIYTTATNTVGFRTADLWLGRSYTIYYFDGVMAEILIYDHVLNSTERGIIKTALAAKYALTLA